MTIIAIYEANHGLIGVAKNYKAAINHLINAHWIDDYTDVWDERTSKWVTIKEAQGEDWVDDMTTKWDIDTFNDFWDGSFDLVTTEVFE